MLKKKRNYLGRFIKIMYFCKDHLALKGLEGHILLDYEAETRVSVAE